MIVSAVGIAAGVATLLQVGVAVIAFGATPRKAFHLWLAALFLLNAVVSANILVLDVAPSPLASDLLVLFDAPTGPVILGAIVALRGGARWAQGALAALGALQAVLHVWARPVGGELTALVINVAYAAACLELASRYARASALEAEAAALLFGGFAVRAAEFALHYGVRRGVLGLGEAGLFPFWLDRAAILLYVVAIGAAAWIALRARHRELPRLTVGVSLAAGAMLGAAELVGLSQSLASYFLTVVTLFFVRPAFVALALAPARARRLLVTMALLVVGYVLAKAALAGFTATSFFELGPLDAIAIGLALIPLPFLPRRRAVAVTVPVQVARRADALLVALASARDARPDGRGLLARELCAAADIAPNNLAGEIRRAAARLAPHLEGAPWLDVREEGIRRRKRYRLTEAGAHAATVWLDGLDGPNAAKAEPPEVQGSQRIPPP